MSEGLTSDGARFFSPDWLVAEVDSLVCALVSLEPEIGNSRICPARLARIANFVDLSGPQALAWK